MATFSAMEERVLLVVIDQTRPSFGRRAKVSDTSPLRPLAGDDPAPPGHNWSVQDIAAEMKELVAGCRGDVVDTVICPVTIPNPATYIGKGKAGEIAGLAGTLKADTVIFGIDLKGGQQRNLEDIIGIKTIDRTQLILDIFARHAVSQEGKMQVELAQLQYLLPRLVGKGVELSRLGGGIGTLGPGETKLEVDRRRIGQRIDRLKKSLRDVSAERGLKRKKRRDRGLPAVSLVGYTNAGKSTLLNVLTQAGQKTHDGLFTTLDSLSRQLVLPNHMKIVLSDTVGFMHDLPLHLIESFKATLEEVHEADLLLVVLDVSHPNFRNRHASVMQVLGELEAADKKIITVLNKIDRLPDLSVLEQLQRGFPNPVAISAGTGAHVADLLEAIRHHLSDMIVEVEVMLPIGRMDLVNLAHNEGQVYSVKYYNDAIHLRAALPTAIAGLFHKEESRDNGVPPPESSPD